MESHGLPVHHPSVGTWAADTFGLLRVAGPCTSVCHTCEAAFVLSGTHLQVETLDPVVTHVSLFEEPAYF